MDLNQELFTAVENSNLPLVKKLLNRDADLNLQDNSGDTLVIIAARKNNFEIVKELLNHGANPNIQDKDGKTALNLAANNNNLDIIKELLNHGANPNIQNRDGNTALMSAASRGQLDMVRELLNHNANPNLQNRDGNTALIMVANNNNLEIVKELLNHHADRSLALERGESGLLYQSQLSTRVEIDPNLQNNDQTTALLKAIRNANLEIVKELLNHHVNRSLALERGESGLLYQSQLSTRVEIDPNLQNNDQTTALLKAIRNANLEIVKELLNRGADPNLQGKLGDTTLIFAEIKGNLEIVKELLNHGANPNVQSNDGATPLEIAYSESKEMADLLLEYGAKLNENLPLAKLYHLPYYPVERYPLTGRPISSMPFLTLGPCSGSHYLPIIRYQSLYYSNNPSQGAYYGTFYYFEPDSNIFLSLGRFLIANNKFHAYLLLLPYIPEDKQINSPRFERFEEITDIHPNQEISKITEENPPYYKDGEYYGIKYIGLFDLIDQIICRAGIKAGYDTIILQAEPGETRTVTEILDLRPRKESFRDVCEVDTPLFHQLAEKSKYPAIWFKSYGFLKPSISVQEGNPFEMFVKSIYFTLSSAL